MTPTRCKSWKVVLSLDWTNHLWITYNTGDWKNRALAEVSWGKSRNVFSILTFAHLSMKYSPILTTAASVLTWPLVVPHWTLIGDFHGFLHELVILYSHCLVHNFSPDRIIWTNIRYTAMKCHSPPRMNPSDFGDLFTFPPVSPGGQTRHLFSEISLHLLHGLAQNVCNNVHGSQMTYPNVV